MTTLNVRNEAQKVLMEELDGQISDGMWENARPMDHWIVWCDAEVVVDPTNVGRDFYAMKDNYNLTSKDLLDVVGDRMIADVIAKTGKPYDMKAMLADLRDLKVIFKTRQQAMTLPQTKPEFVAAVHDILRFR
jgi:hypothetical protein